MVDLARLNNNFYISETKIFAYIKIIRYNHKNKIAHVSSVSKSILHAIVVAQVHHFWCVFCFVMDECMATKDMNYKSKAAQSIYLSPLATFVRFCALSHIKMGSAFSLKKVVMLNPSHTICVIRINWDDDQIEKTK